MYSSHMGEIARALTVGADDFVLKNTRGADLARRLYCTYVMARRSRVDVATGSRIGAIGATMRGLAERLPRLLDSAVRSIYVCAESGAGKEVFVDLLRERVGKDVPFFKINCGAIPPQLLESELFGHVKGAFTGAATDRKGYLASASGGWLVLDEIANLSYAAQTALLRALENREITRLGESVSQTIDLRFIGASNVDLADLVRQGTFRNDLLQRIREVEITLPPLRARPEELDELIDHFCATEAGGPYEMAEEARVVLKSHDWRDGNVRSLRNCIRAMTEKRVDRRLTPLGLPSWFWREHAEHGGRDANPGGAPGMAASTASAEASPWSVAVALRDAKGGAIKLAHMNDLLLAGVLTQWKRAYPRATLRGLAEELGLPKTSLQRRLAKLVGDGLLAADVASSWRSEKSGETT